MKKNKIFSIILVICHFIFPIMMFFNIFDRKIKVKGIDYVLTKHEYYSIININDLHIFYLIIGILFIVFSLLLAIFGILMIIKEKYYTNTVKWLSGISVILFAPFYHYFSISVLIIAFMSICINWFIIAFDIKINKDNKKKDFVIALVTYLVFVILLVLSFGFVPSA